MYLIFHSVGRFGFFWSCFEHFEGTTPMTTKFKTLAEAERFLKEEDEGIKEITVKEFI